YVTGHGEGHDNEHRLILRSSVEGHPSTMLQTRQVLEWLKSRARYAFVVIDTCYSGQLARALASFDADLPEGWTVIATASPYQPAYAGVLADTITKVVAAGAADPAFPYLKFLELWEGLSVELKGQG